MRELKFISVVIVLLIHTSCVNSQQRAFTSPKGYDLNHPVVYKMPAELKEISGNSFYGRNNDTLYAIQDEDGYIYYFKPGDKVLATKFGKKGDYEDVSIYKNTAFVLRSDGKLYGVPMSEIGKPEADNVQEWKGLLPAGEYESMYADEKTNALYIMCKNCEADHHVPAVSLYQFDIAGNEITLKQKIAVETKPLTNFLSSGWTTRFKPSAIAKNPFTNEWYILSSVNKLLVITDAQWHVKQAHPLDKKIFEQPEGISFDTKGNLYISSEAGARAAGVVLKFMYHPNGVR